MLCRCVSFRLHLECGVVYKAFKKILKKSDFVMVVCRGRALYCSKAEKLNWFLPQQCFFIIKGMTAVIMEVTDIALWQWSCIPEFVSFRNTSLFLIQDDLHGNPSFLCCLILTKYMKKDILSKEVFQIRKDFLSNTICIS